ncbi:hypothetical protein [Streptomyces sediminimaris]|uniref:hypothetical protein n=1 Tax=Streptomyces sediminimaris TaxID=3383721 RepID=UPI0039999083
MTVELVYRVRCSGPCRRWLSIPDGYEPGEDIPLAALEPQPTAARAGMWPDEHAARRAAFAAGWSSGTCPDCRAEAQDAPWPVKESTRRYAEELRATPGQASADGHAGWECNAGASLLVSASTPGPGALGTHHGTIYACTIHRDAAVERITGAGYEADPQPAPPGHRWNPWPCGHVTAHDTQALTDLTAAGEQRNGAQT